MSRYILIKVPDLSSLDMLTLTSNLEAQGYDFQWYKDGENIKKDLFVKTDINPKGSKEWSEL